MLLQPSSAILVTLLISFICYLVTSIVSAYVTNASTVVGSRYVVATVSAQIFLSS